MCFNFLVFFFFQTYVSYLSHLWLDNSAMQLKMSLELL